MRILLGFYYGIGDFISAIPMIQELAKNGNVRLTVAIGEQNKGLIPLINLENVDFIYFPLFSFDKYKDVARFSNTIRQSKFDVVLVSPHAQLGSWKMPILLQLLKTRGQQIIGASNDRMSGFYTRRLPIDKTIPLMAREIEMAKLADLIPKESEVAIDNIFKLKRKVKKNCVVIHPGASKPLRNWDVTYHHTLSELITSNGFKVNFIGLEHELAPIERGISNPDVSFLTGSFAEVINIALECKGILTMDSGFGHIASALGLNHFVLVGSANPKYIRPIFPNTTVINNKVLSCQPCNAEKCIQERNFCMDMITPETVYFSMKKHGVFD